MQIYTFLRFPVRVLMKKLKIFDYFKGASINCLSGKMRLSEEDYSR